MPPQRLALVRVLIGGFALHRAWKLSDSLLRRTEAALALVQPVGLMRFLSEPPAPPLAQAVVGLTLVSGAAFVVGWRYRALAPVFAFGLFAMCSYLNSHGMLYHTDQLLVLHVWVLAVARAADAWSVDAYMRARLGQPQLVGGWRYGWPIRLLCALTMSVYWLAAIAKLAAHGWGWALGTALRAQIGKDALRKQLLGSEGAPLGAFVWQNGWVATLVGIGTMVMELGAPLFLFGRRASYLWAAAAFAMHWAILLVMGIKFRYQLWAVAFAPFFPVERLVIGWSRWLGRLRRLLSTPAAPAKPQLKRDVGAP